MTPNELQAYESIRSWLVKRCGIHYPDHKRDLLIQRLNRVQRAFTYSNLGELASNLIETPDNDVELAVISAASTNHTYFFREKETLAVVKDQILPTLSQRQELRIWSAACSTGDEAFTIAMLVADTLGDEALKRTSILGTDISAPVIERAEAGVFAERQIQEVTPSIRNRYLQPIGLGQFAVADRIRQSCTFRRMNLKSTPYPFKHQFQIVFCRNVLYYFDHKDQIATLEAIFEVTEPGGWLITSVTESIRDLPSPWRCVANGVYRKNLA